jgi:hypothetical protein
MDAVELALFKDRWRVLLQKLADDFGDEPDLQAIIFLIGVQELGRGPQKFSKEEKEDLMHIGTCKLLSQYGYYMLEGKDQDGWPHWALVKQMPPLTLREQDTFLKQAVIEYFEKEI